jgi:hypothetical protein
MDFALDMRCPYCKTGVDACTGSSPKEGDISVCFHCGEILIFRDGKPFRKLSPVELIEILKKHPALNEIHKQWFKTGMNSKIH